MLKTFNTRGNPLCFSASVFPALIVKIRDAGSCQRAFYSTVLKVNGLEKAEMPEGKEIPGKSGKLQVVDRTFWHCFLTIPGMAQPMAIYSSVLYKCFCTCAGFILVSSDYTINLISLFPMLQNSLTYLRKCFSFTFWQRLLFVVSEQALLFFLII